MAGVGQNNFHVTLYVICRKKPLIQYGSIWGSCERVSRLRSMRTWGSLWCFIPSRQAAEYNNGTQIQVSSLSLRRTFATSGMEWCKGEVGIKISVFSAVKMLGNWMISTRQVSFVSYLSLSLVIVTIDCSAETEEEIIATSNNSLANAFASYPRGKLSWTQPHLPFRCGWWVVLLWFFLVSHADKAHFYLLRHLQKKSTGKRLRIQQNEMPFSGYCFFRHVAETIPGIEGEGRWVALGWASELICRREDWKNSKDQRGRLTSHPSLPRMTHVSFLLAFSVWDANVAWVSRDRSQSLLSGFNSVFIDLSKLYPHRMVSPEDFL